MPTAFANKQCVKIGVILIPFFQLRHINCKHVNITHLPRIMHILKMCKYFQRQTVRFRGSRMDVIITYAHTMKDTHV